MLTTVNYNNINGNTFHHNFKQNLYLDRCIMIQWVHNPLSIYMIIFKLIKKKKNLKII